MAKRVQVLLVDDIDGGDAAESLSFSLDGVNYEIDLSDEHATALREAFAPWVGHGRRVGGRAGSSRRSSAPRAAKESSSSERNTTAVRVWARANGHTVSDRGRIASGVISAYDAAH